MVVSNYGSLYVSLPRWLIADLKSLSVDIVLPPSQIVRRALAEYFAGDECQRERLAAGARAAEVKRVALHAGIARTAARQRALQNETPEEAKARTIIPQSAPVDPLRQKVFDGKATPEEQEQAVQARVAELECQQAEDAENSKKS